MLRTILGLLVSSYWSLSNLRTVDLISLSFCMNRTPNAPEYEHIVALVALNPSFKIRKIRMTRADVEYMQLYAFNMPDYLLNISPGIQYNPFRTNAVVDLFPFTREY